MFIEQFRSIVQAYRVQCPICGDVNIGTDNEFKPIVFIATKKNKEKIVGYEFECASCKDIIKVLPSDIEDIHLNITY